MRLLSIIVFLAGGLSCGGLKEEFNSSTPSSSPVSTNPVATITNMGNHSLPLPRTISGGFLNDRAKSLHPAEYPPAARRVKASGTVEVQVLVNEDGKVVSVSGSSGHHLLRAAAERAARKAEFEPVQLSGRNVKVYGILKYEFHP
ncbi:MAG: TonB family protein [Acidobacteriota bacterium]